MVPVVEAYRLELGNRGYTPRSVVNELRQVARLSLWLEDRGLVAADLSTGRVEEFLAFQRSLGSHRSQWSRPGLLCLLDVLSSSNVVMAEVPVPPASPVEVVLAEFERYLLSERALAPGTVVGYVSHARRFLGGIRASRELPDITAAQVTAAVLSESAAVSVSTTQNFVAGLRSFLGFCFVEGLLDADLSQAALAITGRRRSSLPRGISKADARAILHSCDRRSALGRRDYAVLITLLRLGLRRGEVAGLRLDDIDWRAGELVVRGKGGRLDRLPLPTDVGEAIASYLRRGRPVSDRREVFLKGRAPLGPIAPGTVASTVRRACRRAGIPEMGSHRLRHTTACDMVAAGVPLVQVAEVLRHRSLQTTAIYGRVDVERLRLLATPWPGSAK
jgi:integrase